MWRSITKSVLIVSPLVIALFDIVVVQYGGVEASISRELYEYACVYPIIPFALGVVCGHLFWGNE